MAGLVNTGKIDRRILEKSRFIVYNILSPRYTISEQIKKIKSWGLDAVWSSSLELDDVHDEHNEDNEEVEVEGEEDQDEREEEDEEDEEEENEEEEEDEEEDEKEEEEDNNKVKRRQRQRIHEY